MAQRLGNIAEWALLTADQGVSFPGKERTIAIEVNSAAPVGLFVILDDEGDEERLVALVEGRDRVEFTVPGGFRLFCEGGDLWYKTMDGEIIVNVEIAPVVFTRIANRKVRNYNLEMMEFKMRQNLEARMEQMERDALARLNDKVNTYAASRRPQLPALTKLIGESASAGSPGQGEEPSEDASRATRTDAVESRPGGKAPKGSKAAASAADD